VIFVLMNVSASRAVCSRRPDEDDEVKARCHYRCAVVDGIVYALDDDVYVQVLLSTPRFFCSLVTFLAARELLRLHRVAAVCITTPASGLSYYQNKSPMLLLKMFHYILKWSVPSVKFVITLFV
jgi:hypothetical protein